MQQKISTNGCVVGYNCAYPTTRRLEVWGYCIQSLQRQALEPLIFCSPRRRTWFV